MTKLMKIRLPLEVYEDFYRLFPGHGERQAILRKLIAGLIDKAEKEKEWLEEVLDELRGGEEE